MYLASMVKNITTLIGRGGEVKGASLTSTNTGGWATFQEMFYGASSASNRSHQLSDGKAVSHDPPPPPPRGGKGRKRRKISR